MRKVLWVVITAAVALSCNEPTTPQEPEYPEATSPTLVLRNVEMSFNRCDVDRLKAMLGRDFFFYFDPNDVGQSPPGSQYIIPESWSYTEFWDALRNMFQQAHSISLTIKKDNVGTPGENENTYRAGNVILDLLVMIDELNGFRAGETGYCNFTFERYEAEGGQKLWRLTGWWDRTAGGGDAAAGSEPASIGKVFAMFK
ncbi:MAG: hypothetical protein JSU81_03860 [Candidatus Coatesbacteria bacterium]|nr:MAG: hypothetical protein JSU81_03860 [Candidatus Coatesbacteria bacterium]